MSVYTKTARKDNKGTIFAFGRSSHLNGHATEKGGYIIFKLCKNYDGKSRGGISKTWRYTDTNLSYSDAIKIMNKKLGREEFREQ